MTGHGNRGRSARADGHPAEPVELVVDVALAAVRAALLRRDGVRAAASLLEAPVQNDRYTVIGVELLAETIVELGPVPRNDHQH